MTRDDIIKAAFKVWGRDLYRTTSLTEIALELGVSKPALYRHFKDKDSLLEAMYPSFFDDCAAFIKDGCEKCENATSKKEAHLILMRTIAAYYIRNKEAFVFSFIRVYNSQDRQNVAGEFRQRGINFEQLISREAEDSSYPSAMQLIVATMVFCTANFHRQNHEAGINKDGDGTPPDEVVK